MKLFFEYFLSGTFYLYKIAVTIAKLILWLLTGHDPQMKGALLKLCSKYPPLLAVYHANSMNVVELRSVFPQWRQKIPFPSPCHCQNQLWVKEVQIPLAGRGKRREKAGVDMPSSRCKNVVLEARVKGVLIEDFQVTFKYSFPGCTTGWCQEWDSGLSHLPLG